MKFIDPRPEMKFAYAVSRWRFRWLYERHPRDFYQALSVAICIEPNVGPKLITACRHELERLAYDLGWYRPRQANERRPWVKDSAFMFSEFVEYKSPWTPAPLCGTQRSYNHGCRCNECKAKMTLIARGRRRAKTKTAVVHRP